MSELVESIQDKITYVYTPFARRILGSGNSPIPKVGERGGRSSDPDYGR